LTENSNETCKIRKKIAAKSKIKYILHEEVYRVRNWQYSYTEPLLVIKTWSPCLESYGIKPVALSGLRLQAVSVNNSASMLFGRHSSAHRAAVGRNTSVGSRRWNELATTWVVYDAPSVSRIFHNRAPTTAAEGVNECRVRWPAGLRARWYKFHGALMPPYTRCRRIRLVRRNYINVSGKKAPLYFCL